MVGIIGAGKWGQALAYALSKKNTVKIYSRTPRDIPGFTTLDEVMKCKYIIFAISTQNVKQFLTEHFVFKGQKILIASKGIDVNSKSFLFDIFKDFVPKKNLCYLSGPSFANEVMNDLPTALVISSKNKKLAHKFSTLFPSLIKTYVTKDVIGAEVAGAYKNVLAIAAGVSEGLELGNNARAGLISRGLVEMNRFGKKFGAKKSTFLNLSGAGDLFLTASSVQSRNFRVGLGLAKGKSLEDILEEMGEVAEGIETAKAIVMLAEEYNVYTPIASEVSQMLLGQSPNVTVNNLLKRSS